MGQGYLLRCKKCLYEEEVMLGIGFMFIQENKRIKDAIISGKLGKNFQNLAQKTPDFSVVNERKVFVCDRCGDLRQEMYIAIYDGEKKLHEKGYRCARCQGKMIPNDDVMKLKCPDCKEPLTATVDWDWD